MKLKLITYMIGMIDALLLIYLWGYFPCVIVHQASKQKTNV